MSRLLYSSSTRDERAVHGFPANDEPRDELTDLIEDFLLFLVTVVPAGYQVSIHDKVARHAVGDLLISCLRPIALNQVAYLFGPINIAKNHRVGAILSLSSLYRCHF